MTVAVPQRAVVHTPTPSRCYPRVVSLDAGGCSVLCIVFEGGGSPACISFEGGGGAGSPWFCGEVFSSSDIWISSIRVCGMRKYAGEVDNPARDLLRH